MDGMTEACGCLSGDPFPLPFAPEPELLFFPEYCTTPMEIHKATLLIRVPTLLRL